VASQLAPDMLSGVGKSGNSLVNNPCTTCGACSIGCGADSSAFSGNDADCSPVCEGAVTLLEDLAKEQTINMRKHQESQYRTIVVLQKITKRYDNVTLESRVKFLECRFVALITCKEPGWLHQQIVST
jgi:hypothetical protein